MKTNAVLTSRRTFVVPAEAKAVELRDYLPESIRMIATLRRAFWQNTNHLYPNRMLITEKFAVALCREMALAMGIPVPVGGKPIVKPGAMIFNMRVHIIPDNFMALPCELSFAQELDLPAYMRRYMTDEQKASIELERNGYTTYDFGNLLQLPQYSKP